MASPRPRSGIVWRAVVAVCVAALVVPIAAARAGDAPRARASATCADYANQAAAQRAADTIDADGDGIYCESLPCPCLKPGDGGATPTPTATPEPGGSTRCSTPTGVQTISFSKTKYAHSARTRCERSTAAGPRRW